MKTNIQIFTSDNFGKIRTCLVDNQIMFVGKDVAKALGYSNTRKALQDHVDEEDKRDGVTIRDSIGRIQKAVLINESGLYSLILSSKLPQACGRHRFPLRGYLPHAGDLPQPLLFRRRERFLPSAGEVRKGL